MDLQELYQEIKAGKNMRQNLSAIRAALKEKEGGREKLEWLRTRFQEEPETLLPLLKSEDAKTRKNAALVLGSIGSDVCRDALLLAYQAETQRFVKSSYLIALQGCDCAECADFFRERQTELIRTERTPETEKHIREELEAVNVLLSRLQPQGENRRFAGLDVPSDVILTAWKEHREVTARQIAKGSVSLLGSGIRVREADLRELLTIRTWRELLFCLNGEELNPEKIAAEQAEALLSSGLLELLERHLPEGTQKKTPWRFRIECRSRMTQEQKNLFTKRLADGLMQRSKGLLINDVSAYEVEIRLLEKKSGAFLPLVKFPSLPDHRFSYRKNSTAASMQPSLAALLAKLAEPYLKEEARVLDPFCGVGTLLLERNYLVHADTLYGVDLFAPAITGARENAAIAGVPVHFVNRDMRDFRHEYRFDEIFTDMPSAGGKRTSHETDLLYRYLFERAEGLLKPGAMLFVYTHDRGFAKKRLRECANLRLEREWRISEKEDAWFLAVRMTAG